jgi:hypothetical protein
MTYLKSNPSAAIAFAPIDGIAIVDHYEHRQTKCRDGQVRWSVMTADEDLGEIWMSEGSYFSKFSTNQGCATLDEAIGEILEATASITTLDDFDFYPADELTSLESEFAAFMTAPVSKAFKVEAYKPKNQTEATAMQRSGGEWLSIWSDGEVNCDRVVPSRYRQIGVIKAMTGGKAEYYVGNGLSIGRNKVADSIDAALQGVKKAFITQQALRYSAIWADYLG